MSRFVPYLGVVAALLVALFSISFLETAPTTETLSVPPPALSVIIPTSSESKRATSSPVTTTPAALPTRKSVKPEALVSSPARSTPSPPIAPAPTAAALDAAASALRNALVNIICYAPAGGRLNSVSGSGVIIDPKGIILTNAHVAQSFLLADRGVSCIVRAGSPAVDHYEAAPLFISPSWLRTNASLLTQAVASGTGEHDFALLAITKSVTRDALPSAFPFLPLAPLPSPPGTPVVIASYGAQFLGPDQVQFSLSPTVVFGSVKDVFTFGENTIDVLALGGSAAAQEGSSGGGIVDASGSLVGTITTSTVEGATNTRSLDAITASYIRADYASETGQAIDLLLAKPTATSILDFASQSPALEAILTAQLP